MTEGGVVVVDVANVVGAGVALFLSLRKMAILAVNHVNHREKTLFFFQNSN